MQMAAVGLNSQVYHVFSYKSIKRIWDEMQERDKLAASGIDSRCLHVATFAYSNAGAAGV